MSNANKFEFWNEQGLKSRLAPLQQQIDSLEIHIQADLEMKNQLETDLRHEESARRKAFLNESIKESKRNLKRHEEEREDLLAKYDAIVKKYSSSNSEKVINIGHTEDKSVKPEEEKSGSSLITSDPSDSTENVPSNSTDHNVENTRFNNSKQSSQNIYSFKGETRRRTRLSSQPLPKQVESDVATRLAKNLLSIPGMMMH